MPVSCNDSILISEKYEQSDDCDSIFPPSSIAFHFTSQNIQFISSFSTQNRKPLFIIETGENVHPLKKPKTKKVYFCDFVNCRKTFKSKENFNLHIRTIHKNEKPYSCSYCSKKYTHRAGKLYHERSKHTNNLPYVCILCQKRFACSSAMKWHIKSVHESKKDTKITTTCKSQEESDDKNKNVYLNKKKSCMYYEEKEEEVYVARKIIRKTVKSNNEIMTNHDEEYLHEEDA